MNEKIKYWLVPVIIGILLSITAIYLTMQPVKAFAGLSILFGWLIFINGGLNLSFAIRNRKVFKSWIWYLINGIIEMIIGAVLLFQPEISAQALIIFTGFWMMFSSVSRIRFAFILKKEKISNWIITLISGILAFIFSILIIFNPFFAIFSIVYLTAVPMLIIGILLIWFGIQIKKLNNSLN